MMIKFSGDERLFDIRYRGTRVSAKTFGKNKRVS